MRLKTAEIVSVLLCLALLVSAAVLASGRERDSEAPALSVTTPEPEVTEAVRGMDGLVNINTADAEELDGLTGIGPALAGNIIEYREEHGPFESTADIMEVSGIGPATFEKFKDEITV